MLLFSGAIFHNEKAVDAIDTTSFNIILLGVNRLSLLFIDAPRNTN